MFPAYDNFQIFWTLKFGTPMTKNSMLEKQSDTVTHLLVYFHYLLK